MLALFKLWLTRESPSRASYHIRRCYHCDSLGVLDRVPIRVAETKLAIPSCIIHRRELLSVRWIDSEARASDLDREGGSPL